MFERVRLGLPVVLALAALLPAGTAGAGQDRNPPRTRFITPDGAVLRAGLDSIEGVTWDRSGVKDVSIYVLANEPQPWQWTVPLWPVPLSCDTSRKVCSWTWRPVDVTPGDYWVGVVHRDLAENAGDSRYIRITMTL